MKRVEVKPELFVWARKRARLNAKALARRFPHLETWENGSVNPTLKQLEDFSKATFTPIGFLFLQKPPVEHVPISDFRRIDNEYLDQPSPDMLDVIYICQQRQEWYRDYARSVGEEQIAFVGSVGVTDDIVSTAASIRRVLAFDIEERRRLPTWTDALRRFIEQADATGILVMCSGVVLNNNRRQLDPDEFRGFALMDKYAPLVFINGADTKAAQMFTLAHELAHIWIGQSAISDAQAVQLPSNPVERWCNQVAAELLVPFAIIQGEYDRRREVHAEVERLARRFKVSTLVILRRIYDIGALSREELRLTYDEELRRLRAIPRKRGGNFYLTQAARVGKRFATGLVASTLEGQTLYRDAFRMLGSLKLETFHELGRSLGIIS
jgi:Zn-dependent peptidase ImmA (M78 family)